MSKYLPSDSYKQQLSLYSSFNNNLLSGLSQGLNLYSPQQDLTLYKQIDTKPLDNVSFDKINKQIDDNENIFNNVKSTISGGLSGTLEGVSDGLNKFMVNSLGLDSNAIKTYIGILLLFIIILKKI
jgi:hypothetical protein